MTTDPKACADAVRTLLYSLNDRIESATEFLEERYGNSDGLDWADGDAGATGDMLDECRRDIAAALASTAQPSAEPKLAAQPSAPMDADHWAELYRLREEVKGPEDEAQGGETRGDVQWALREPLRLAVLELPRDGTSVDVAAVLRAIDAIFRAALAEAGQPVVKESLTAPPAAGSET